MLWGGLHQECRDYADFIERQVAYGLDAVVELPTRPPRVVDDHYNLHGLPVSYDPRVTIRERLVRIPGEEWPIMVKEYDTPAGILSTEVRQTADWRWGNHVPFLDDYLEPRSRRFLVNGPDDLEALRFLLVPPTATEIKAFQADAGKAQSLARKHSLAVSGGWGVGADMLGWLTGLQSMMLDVFDRPAYLKELLALIAAWNLARQRIVMAAGIDLYVRRAWYENCDFWTPEAWREFLFPLLKAEVDDAHERGVRFGYLITSACHPLLDDFVRLGIDVVIGVDPVQWDLAAAKRRIGSAVCLWGGVNGHLTVEKGTPSLVRDEVGNALRLLGPDGFILSPVDNVRVRSEVTRKNVEALIDEWRLRSHVAWTH
jgi:hypothetical protein